MKAILPLLLPENEGTIKEPGQCAFLVEKCVK